MKNVYGATISNFQDGILAFLFPAGMLSFLNFIVLGIAGLFFGIGILYYKKMMLEDDRSKKSITLMVGALIIVGGFIPGLTLLIAIIFLGFSLFYLIDSRKIAKQEASSKTKIILPSFFLLLSALLFMICLVGGVLFAFLAGYWIHGWSWFVGAMIGLITILFKHPKRFRIYNKPFRSENTIKTLKVVFIILPIVLSGLFILSFIPFPHQNGPENPTSTELTSLSIMTYNIRNGRAVEDDPKNQWWNRKEEFIQYLDGFDLDIFGIQEAFYFQVEQIHLGLRSRKYEWTGLSRDNGVLGGEGTPIFFDGEKFEFMDGDTFWLSNITDIPSNTFSGNMNRVCTWARFRVQTGSSKDAQFCVFNTHYDFSDEWQVKASHLISKKILEYSGGLPVFLMGDFNLRNTSVAFPLLENYQNPGSFRPMRDSFRVYKEATIGYLPYETSSPRDWDVRKDPSDKSRIDFIFISEQVQVTSCNVIKDSYDEYRTYSDHYPVLLECSF